MHFGDDLVGAQDQVALVAHDHRALGRGKRWFTHAHGHHESRELADDS